MVTMMGISTSLLYLLMRLTSLLICRPEQASMEQCRHGHAFAYITWQQLDDGVHVSTSLVCQLLDRVLYKTCGGCPHLPW
jgi:hypothetical protein